MIKIRKIHHIGIAVKNLEKSMEFWCDILGLPLMGLETVTSHNVQVSFLSTGESNIELVMSTNENSNLKKQVNEKGGGLDHLCLEVENISEVLEELSKHGIKLINPEPVELPGRKIAFVEPSFTDGVLLEFYELT